VEVPLANVVLLGIDPIVVASQEDAFALTAIFWFDYEGFSLAIIELVFKGF
jgi:hypothetical protein